MSSNAPAGWYPQHDGTERWWDGRAWSAHSRPVPPPPTAPPSSAGRYGADPGSAPYATWAPAAPTYVVAAKNPAVALIASFFIPGLGTMLNGEVAKGVAILVGWIGSWILTFLLVPFLITFGLWVYGMIDAYAGAQRWNRAHGIIS